jgi:hypothetical protein
MYLRREMYFEIAAPNIGEMQIKFTLLRIPFGCCLNDGAHGHLISEIGPLWVRK